MLPVRKPRERPMTMTAERPETGFGQSPQDERVGTPEQKEKWLKPLLEGKIRSAYCMTELNYASSDAKNIETRATLVGDEYVFFGVLLFFSGVGVLCCLFLFSLVL